MHKGKYKKPKPIQFPVTTVVLAVVCVVLAILLLRTCQHTPASTIEGETTVPETTVEKNKGSISVPGYEMLELKADSREQEFSLENPPQNNCYFEISLYLEDGTLLWKSELIEPGQATKPLKLSRELTKGYYAKAVLHYDCYAMDADKTPLNGAEMKVTLWVK